MSDFDLDRLGDVWRQQPDPAEMERLQKSAVAVARRARLGRVFDIGAALAISAVVILIVASNPKLGTVLIGAAALLVLLGSNVRLRRLREVELQTLSGSTEGMLDQSIQRLETTIKYRWFSLGAGVPALVLGVILGTRTGASSRLAAIFSQFGEITKHRYLLEGMVAAVVIVAALLILRSIGRGKRELERLRAMREAYRREGESSAP